MKRVGVRRKTRPTPPVPDYRRVRRRTKPIVPDDVDTFAREARAWLTANNVDADVARLQETWQATVDHFRPEIADATVRAYAMADAVNRALDTVRFGLRLRDSGENRTAAFRFIVQLWQAEVVRVVLAASELTADVRAAIMTQQLARIFEPRRGSGKFGDDAVSGMVVSRGDINRVIESYKKPNRREP